MYFISFATGSSIIDNALIMIYAKMLNLSPCLNRSYEPAFVHFKSFAINVLPLLLSSIDAYAKDGGEELYQEALRLNYESLKGIDMVKSWPGPGQKYNLLYSTA